MLTQRLIVVTTLLIALCGLQTTPIMAQEFDEFRPPENQAVEPEFEIVQLPRQHFLLREMQGSYEQHSEVIPQLYQHFGPRGIDMSKPVVGFYLNDPDEVEDENDLRWKIGMEVGKDIEAFDPYKIETYKPTRALSYEIKLVDLESASQLEKEWLDENGYEADGVTRMEYIGMDPDPNAMKVIVLIPVKRIGADDEQQPRHIVEATFDDMRFLTGTWLADMDGDIMVEQWSPPIGNSITGSFQYTYDGKVVFMYELMTIQRSEKGEMTLLLRHFDSDLTPWPNNEPMILKLGTLEENSAEFINQSDQGDVRGIRYESPSEDELVASLLPRDPKKDDEVIKFKRVKERK